MAGTSAKGQCPKCGNAWERMVDVKQYPRHETEYADFATDGNGANRGKHAQPTERKKGKEIMSKYSSELSKGEILFIKLILIMDSMLLKLI